MENWEELGHEINYDPIKLQQLSNSGQGSEKCREDMVTDWARQGDASWMKLAEALSRMEKDELAEKIKQEYIPSPQKVTENEG